MIGAEMILEVVDRLIKLLRAKKRQKRELFTDILEPLFRDLEPVVDEYFNFFRQSRSFLTRSRGKCLPEVVAELRELREQFVVARIKVTEMVQAIREETKSPVIIRFLNSVDTFFFSTNVRVEIPRNKRISKLKKTRSTFMKGRSIGKKSQKKRFIRMIERRIDLLKYVGREELSKKDLLLYIDATIKNLEERWKKIAKCYGELRIYCLKP